MLKWVKLRIAPVGVMYCIHAVREDSCECDSQTHRSGCARRAEGDPGATAFQAEPRSRGARAVGGQQTHRGTRRAHRGTARAVPRAPAISLDAIGDGAGLCQAERIEAKETSRGQERPYGASAQDTQADRPAQDPSFEALSLLRRAPPALRAQTHAHHRRHP